MATFKRNFGRIDYWIGKGKLMENILDYLKKYGEVDFDRLPFNEVDSLVMAQFIYNDLKIVAKLRYKFKIKELDDDQLAKELSAITWLPKEGYQLIKLMAGSKRYGDLEITDFYQLDSYEESGQFTAFTTRIDHETILLVYRGTDSSFSGWAESLAMSFDEEIPAQTSAKNYLESIAKKYDGRIILTGHSKGGNLVVFAASTVDKEIQDRIKRVYNLDGPGFLPEFYKRADYSSIGEKVRLLLPKSSVFGMLLDGVGTLEVVDAKGILIEQHSPYNWHLKNGVFKTLDQVDSISKFTNDSINKWMKSIDREERKNIIKLIFNLFDQTGAANLKEIVDGKYESYKRLRQGLDDMNQEEFAKLRLGFDEFVNVIKDGLVNSYKNINIRK